MRNPYALFAELAEAGRRGRVAVIDEWQPGAPPLRMARFGPDFWVVPAFDFGDPLVRKLDLYTCGVALFEGHRVMWEGRLRLPYPQCTLLFQAVDMDPESRDPDGEPCMIEHVITLNEEDEQATARRQMILARVFERDERLGKRLGGGVAGVLPYPTRAGPCVWTTDEGLIGIGAEGAQIAYARGKPGVEIRLDRVAEITRDDHRPALPDQAQPP